MNSLSPPLLHSQPPILSGFSAPDLEDEFIVRKLTSGKDDGNLAMLMKSQRLIVDAFSQFWEIILK